MQPHKVTDSNPKLVMETHDAANKSYSCIHLAVTYNEKMDHLNYPFSWQNQANSVFPSFLLQNFLYLVLLLKSGDNNLRTASFLFRNVLALLKVENQNQNVLGTKILMLWDIHLEAFAIPAQTPPNNLNSLVASYQTPHCVRLCGLCGVRFHRIFQPRIQLVEELGGSQPFLLFAD